MKYLKYLSYVLLAVSAVLIIAFYATGTPEGMVTTVLNWALILIVLALVSAVVMPMFFSSGKGMKGTLIKLGVVLVLCLVSYLFATSAPLEVKVNVHHTETALKFTDAGLILTCILLAGAFLSIVSGAIINIFRNR